MKPYHKGTYFSFFNLFLRYFVYCESERNFCILGDCILTIMEQMQGYIYGKLVRMMELSELQGMCTEEFVVCAMKKIEWLMIRYTSILYVSIFSIQ